MKTPHTPGPWKCARIHPDPDTAKSYIEILPETGGALGDWSSLPIAGLNCAEAGGIQEANATLISAAPEMLAALEECIVTLEHGTLRVEMENKAGHPIMSAWLGDAYKTIDAAQAAIKKATHPTP